MTSRIPFGRWVAKRLRRHRAQHKVKKGPKTNLKRTMTKTKTRSAWERGRSKRAVKHDTKGRIKVTKNTRKPKSTLRFTSSPERDTVKTPEETVAAAWPETKAKMSSRRQKFQTFTNRHETWLRTRQAREKIEKDAKAKLRFHEKWFHRDTKGQLQRIDTLLKYNKMKLLADKTVSGPTAALERRKLEEETEELKNDKHLLEDEIRTVKKAKRHGSDKVDEIQRIMETRRTLVQQREPEDKPAAARQRAEVEEKEAEKQRRIKEWRARQNEENLVEMKRQFAQMMMERSQAQEDTKPAEEDHLADVKRHFEQIKLRESEAQEANELEDEVEKPAEESHLADVKGHSAQLKLGVRGTERQ